MTAYEKKERISLFQLFTLILNFEIGSAIVVGIGNEARQDAWIAVLFAGLIGLGYTWLYCRMAALAPGRHLFEMMEDSWGRVIAAAVSMIYVVYFLYIASRVLRDFSELIVTAVLVNTPVEVIALSMMLLIAYILNSGIEVLCRTAEIFTPYILLLLFVLAFFILVSGELEWTNMLPILPEGWKPVAKAVFPSLVGFPFGEMLLFTIISKYAHQPDKQKYVGRILLLGVGVAGSLLVLSTLTQVMALGPDIKERSNFPLLSAARQISIASFIERVDAVVVFIMMLGIIIKVSVYFYAGLRGLEHTFRIPYRQLNMPIALLIALLSIFISDNFSEHIEEGIRFVPLYMHFPLQLLVPAILFLFLFFNSRNRRNVSS